MIVEHSVMRTVHGDQLSDGASRENQQLLADTKECRTPNHEAPFFDQQVCVLLQEINIKVLPVLSSQKARTQHAIPSIMRLQKNGKRRSSAKSEMDFAVV